MALRSEARNCVAGNVALTRTELDAVNHGTELVAMIYGVELGAVTLSLL
jgi:hypothetical protein